MCRGFPVLRFVEMDILTLVLMIVVSILGSFVMADVVSKFDRKKVRYALFVGLFILASVVLMKNLALVRSVHRARHLDFAESSL